MTEEPAVFRPVFPVPQLPDEAAGELTLIHGFEGFGDAGSAVHIATRFLKESLDGEKVAEFDVDQLIDHRSRRPQMTMVDGRLVEYSAPHLEMWVLRDATGRAFVLLEGAEPDYRWERVASAVSELSERWGIHRSLSLTAVPMGVPHTRPVPVLGHAVDQEQLRGIDPWHGSMRFPSSMSTMIDYRLQERGWDVVGIAAHVPNYLAQADFPQAALALLGAVESLTGLSLPREALERDAATAEEQLTEQVEDSPEIQQAVRALEEQYDTFMESQANRKSLLASAEGHLPSGDEIGAEFERFLAETSESTEDGSGDTDTDRPEA